MRKSQAARYARWAAVVASLLVAIAAGVYTRRAWQAAQARRKAPPAVPATVEKQSAEFAFSKVVKDRTLFTVRASRTTEFKDQGKSLLEDVWITIYGQQGGRYDNIHTRKCDYAPATGRIACQGEVQLDLESAEEARTHPGQRVIHIATRNISFDRETGEAATDQPVDFRFPYGEGRGIGVTYRTQVATVELHHDVELHLSSPSASSGPVVLTGGSMDYRRNEHVLRLRAPVRVLQDSREMTAETLELELDASLRARRAVASGRPLLGSKEGASRATLEADQIASFFNPAGWTERLVAEGKVRGSRMGPGAEDHVAAERVELELVPGGNQPRQLTAEGNVLSESVRDGRTERLSTASLRVMFVPAGQGAERRIDFAESLAPATLEWQTGAEQTKLQAEKLSSSFDQHNRLRAIQGRGGVRVDRKAGTAEPELITSQDLTMDYTTGGDWSQVEQTGDVRFRQGDRSGRADRSRLVRASDTVLLSGSAAAADSQSRTTAQTILFNQRTGEIRADGAVSTTYLSVDREGPANLAPEPAHIVAARLVGNNSTGEALYSGRARLWQGDAVIEADSIQLLRQAQRLEARGSVLADLPQAPGPAPAAARNAAATPGRTLWHVAASRLTYWSAEGRAHFEEGAHGQSQQAQIDARAMDLYLVRRKTGPAQLDHATATGQVTVRQGDRRGTSDQADYDATQGKVVLSGGHPTLYDSLRGTTVGRQLTFFLSNDKIFVDSDEGSRTLTTHRVEK